MKFSMLVTPLLTIHITCGFTALASSLGAMLSPKGQSRHRRFGRFFFYGMTGVFITAIPLSIILKNQFLFLIAIFSYYLVLSGWRFAKNTDGVTSTLDYIISGTMLISSFIMIGFGLCTYNSAPTDAIILLVFGVISCTLSYSDLKAYRNHTVQGKNRIALHLSAMLGATIAAITAFLVTNIHINPVIILWLGPTVLLTPVIVWWKRKVLNGKW